MFKICSISIKPHHVGTHYATATLLLRLQALHVDHFTPFVTAALSPLAEIDARDIAHERFALVCHIYKMQFHLSIRL